MNKGFFFHRFLALCLVVGLVFTAVPMAVFATANQNFPDDLGQSLSDSFFIRNKNSGKYLTADGNQGQNGVNVLQRNFTGGINQQWKLQRQPDGSYQIISALPGSYRLDVSGNRDLEGANLHLWQSSQTFRLKKTAEPYYKLETSASEAAKKVVRVSNNSKASGANVEQGSFGTTGNDQWAFDPVYPSNNQATKREKQAVSEAKQYLKDTISSYEKLVTHLVKNKGFTQKEAQYGADHAGVNWNKQALKRAKIYLHYTPYSRQQLIHQLTTFDRFTKQQARYAADQSGSNWMDHAAQTAKNYLSFSSYSRDRFIEVLLQEGFTLDEATYGVDHCGANYKKHAVKTAKEFLEECSCTKQQLINRLINAGFTPEEAAYGASKSGL